MRISIYVTLCDFVTVLHFYSYGSFLQIIIQRLLLLQFLLALLLFLRLLYHQMLHLCLLHLLCQHLLLFLRCLQLHLQLPDLPDQCCHHKQVSEFRELYPHMTEVTCFQTL